MRERHKKSGDVAMEVQRLNQAFESFMVVPNGYVVTCDVSDPKNQKITQIIQNSIASNTLGFGAMANLDFSDSMPAPVDVPILL